MTTVYFVRHAEPNYGNHNDRLRELCAWQKIKSGPLSAALESSSPPVHSAQGAMVFSRESPPIYRTAILGASLDPPGSMRKIRAFVDWEKGKPVISPAPPEQDTGGSGGRRGLPLR